MKDLVFRREDIDITYGVVTGIDTDDRISLEVRPFKLSEGEEAMKLLMDKRDFSKREAEESIQILNELFS